MRPIRMNAWTNVAELGGDAEVAGERERESGAGRDAVDSGDHRLVHGTDGADRRGVVIPEHRSHVESTVGRGGTEILTAAEAAPRAGDDHRANGAARGCLDERPGDLIEEPRGDRIEDLRPVERQGEDPVAHGPEQLRGGGRRCFGGHGGELYADALPSSRRRSYV